MSYPAYRNVAQCITRSGLADATWAFQENHVPRITVELSGSNHSTTQPEHLLTRQVGY